MTKDKILFPLFLINLSLAFFQIIFLKLNLPFFQIFVSSITQTLITYYIIKNPKKYNIDFLFFLSLISVFFLSIYEVHLKTESHFYIHSIISVVYFLVKIIESKTIDKMEKTFSGLNKLLPRKVLVLKNGKEKFVPLETLRPGDIIILKPGEKIPADGLIIHGDCVINQSLITGESEGVKKFVGNKIISGTTILNGSIKVKVEKVGKETYLSQIAELIKTADKSKEGIQESSKEKYKIFMGFVIGVFFITFFSWYFFTQNFYLSLKNSTNVVLISSNASLILASPMAVIFSLIVLAKKGIIVKNPRTITMLPEIEVFIFDKTGTLTCGSPLGYKICPVKGFSEEDVLKYFLIAEKNSQHPLTKMVVDNLGYSKNIPDVESFREDFGFGVTASYKGKVIEVGNRQFLEKRGIDFSLYQSFSSSEKFIVCIEKKIVGSILLKEKLKQDSKMIIQFLKKKEKDVIMLTGDEKSKALSVARQLEIKKVFFGVSPEKKLSIVKKIAERKKVAMIGDGVNDAPSLAMAHVGISMNKDVDLISESSDIVLASDDLKLLKDLLIICDHTKTKIRQNIFWTYLYNIIAITIATGVFISLGISIDPLIACAASISSTLSIMINSFLFR